MSERGHLQGCWVKFGVDLHPSKSEDVMGGVREQLHKMLLRYNESLEGVMLSYSKEKILSQQARIHPYFPYFHVDVMALVVLFKPVPGHLLTGVVNAIGHDYIGCLVLGVFNTFIRRTNIPADFQCRPLEGAWTSSKNRYSRIEVGTPLRFAVHQVHHEGEFFNLDGSLMDVDLMAQPAAVSGTAAAQHVSEPAPDGNPSLPNGKKVKRRQQTVPAEAGESGGGSGHSARLPADSTAEDGAATQQPAHRKTKRREDVQAAAAVPVPNGVAGSEAGGQKKKKKRKREGAAEI